MEDLMKMILKQRKQESFSPEDIPKEVYAILKENDSEMDKWYKVGDSFWLRRTTDTDYMSVQVFPLVDDSYLCYLHIISVADYEKQRVERYNKNADTLPEDVPYDIKYIYPIALSQDIESAKEKFLAGNGTMKNDWLKKMGIRGNE